MSQINYSEAINEDGVFGERSRDSWQRAYDDWYNFGSMNIPSSYGFFIQLNTLEELEKEFQEQKDAFEALLPGVALRLSQEKQADLTQEEIDAMSTPFGERTGEQFTKAALGEEKLKVTYTETAYAAPDHLRTQAIKMADDLNAIEERLKAVDRYRQVVNFENWRMRCELEKTDDALLAHQFIYDGNTEFDQGDLAGAEENYVQGMAFWRKVLDQFPGIIEDRDTGEDLAKVIANYRAILDQNDKEFPDPFVLQDILDRYGDSSN